MWNIVLKIAKLIENNKEKKLVAGSYNFSQKYFLKP